jgi:macrolide transport system ATP-binding/permease protein
MRQARIMLHRLRGLFRRRALDAEMKAELQAHLDGLTERNIAAGMSAEEARYAATRAFGGVAQIAERARDERRSLWVEQVLQDVRYAVRSLAKSPSFTITAVLTLAFGIGVNAALFSVVNLVALRPLPVKDPDDLIRIAGRDARAGLNRSFNHAEYLAYRDGTRTLDGLLAFTETKWSFESEVGMPAAEGRGSSRVPVELVSENYFAVLGGPIQLGRAFRPEETAFGAAPVIVLSNVFWETRLQRDPNIVGATLMLDRRLVTVIGVASAEFSGQRAMPPAGWLPLSAWSSRPGDFEPAGPQAFGLVGRLKPGITEAQAKADLDAITTAWAAQFPRENPKLSVWLERGLRFMSLTRTAKGTQFLGLVFLSFALVLVIACTNVTNLLLARGVSRQPEIGVRLALGASRGRIVRQLLTENLLLCVLGAVLGLGLAVWTLQLLLPVVVSRLPIEWAMESRHIGFFKTTPDARVLGFTALLTAGAALTAGLLPAWQASGGSLYAAARNEGSAFGRRLTPSRLRHGLVIVQVAVSLTLLSCAGVLVRNLLEQQSTEVGYDAHAVFGVSLAPNPAIADRTAAFHQALETVRTIPGVAASAAASSAPLFGAKQARIRFGGTDERVQELSVTEGFFDAFGIALLRGRTFHRHELQLAARSVVVSETLARRLWPGREAVGQSLAISEASWATRQRPAPPDAYRECEVIGVAHDIMMDPLSDTRQVVYLPFPREHGGGQVYVRPHRAAAAELAEIVRAAKAEGVELQFERRHSFWVGFLTLPFYAFAVTSASLGALALGMAAVGLHGLMAFAVNQRVREIGVRMALGATTQGVVGLFVRQGMRLVAVGLVLGVIGGALFMLTLSKLLHGFVGVFDPVAFGTVTLLFAVIALFACWLPARRATKVDPVVALRAE